MAQRRIAGGKLVVIEGTDGAGKGTQCRGLGKRIERQGIPVHYEDFPNYKESPFGTTLGRFLHGEFGGINDVNPYVAAGIFAADRATHLEGILQALNEGKVVVANR